MLNIISIVKEFEGIIGAILGVIATLITTKCLESWGRLEYYIDNVIINYYSSDDYGGYKGTQSMEDVEYIECEFRIEVYNSSDVIKPLKNIKTAIITENNYIESIVSDISTHRISAAASKYDEVLLINYNPKEIKEYNLRFSLRSGSFIDNKVEKIKEIYFIANDIKNKKIKIEVYKHI